MTELKNSLQLGGFEDKWGGSTVVQSIISKGERVRFAQIQGHDCLIDSTSPTELSRIYQSLVWFKLLLTDIGLIVFSLAI